MQIDGRVDCAGALSDTSITSTLTVRRPSPSSFPPFPISLLRDYHQPAATFGQQPFPTTVKRVQQHCPMCVYVWTVVDLVTAALPPTSPSHPSSPALPYYCDTGG